MSRTYDIPVLHVVITGNPDDGFRYHGPFVSHEALAWVEEQRWSGTDWSIVPLRSPEDES